MRFSTILLSIILLAGIVGMACAQGEHLETPVAPGTEVGYFSLNSVPSGADVVFDGIFQGETPVVVTVSTTGNAMHTISMTLAGYDPWSSTYQGNPKAGQTIPITATLIHSVQTGSIAVSSSPSGATAVLDDTKSAYTPTTFSDVPVGSHTISIYKDGYQDFYTAVNVQKGVEPIFTPSTKTEIGLHDENISFGQAEKIVGEQTISKLKDISLEIYKSASEFALSKGIIIADTKMEFGFHYNQLILVDEVLTPDSSRFWPADHYQKGRSQESYDKQIVRDYLVSIKFNKQPPPPILPDDVIRKTSNKYLEVLQKLTGETLI